MALLTVHGGCEHSQHSSCREDADNWGHSRWRRCFFPSWPGRGKVLKQPAVKINGKAKKKSPKSRKMYDGERERRRRKRVIDLDRQIDGQTEWRWINVWELFYYVKRNVSSFFMEPPKLAMEDQFCYPVRVCVWGGVGGDNPLISQFRIKIMKKEQISRRRRINGRRGRF